MKTKGLDPKIARINNLAGAKASTGFAPFTAQLDWLRKNSLGERFVTRTQLEAVRF
jgi:hypothetical protein